MKDKHYRKAGIKLVAAIYFVVAIVALAVLIVFVGYHLFRRNVKENYEKYTKTVLNNAYSITEEYDFGDMISNREMSDGYEAMREHLNKVKENSDIEYLYAIYFDDINDIHSLTYAINTKTSEELQNGGTYTYLGTPCEAGSFEDETIRILQSAVQNRQKECGVLEGHSSEYGFMLNGYRVIFDSADNPVGLLCVEIDVNDINKEIDRYIRFVVIIVAIFAFVVTVIYLIRIEGTIISPIAKITTAADDFVKNMENQDSVFEESSQERLDEFVKQFRKLDIHSGDEIEKLYLAVSSMTLNQVEQIRSIRKLSESTAKMQDGLIITMADIVENRDSDTGAHVQKTAAYVKIITEGLKNKGYYPEKLTPKFMADVVRSAPLHDVGKINIPDAVLNKPGKLTDEEYAIIKTHTIAGKKIMDHAIGSVEGDSYLKEARNMAAYHHERWDGKGYPEGLHGEVIPLSARIMAVADVFDALASPRIYKPAFPLEKALEIIEEGKGTQFDPKCVEVFLEARSKVEEVLRKYQQNQ